MDSSKFSRIPHSIFDGPGYSEDFVVVKRSSDNYIAFHTSGTEQEQRLHIAFANNPLGPFEGSYKPIYPSKMRLGSIVSPCEQTNGKWRLYFNRIYDYNSRTLSFIESDSLEQWHNETCLNVHYKFDTCLFDDERSFFVQPCCRIVNGVFFLIVNRVVRTLDRSVDYSVVDSFISYDGINFMPYKTPLIKPKLDTLYSKKIGNPYFIYKDGMINIFAEGNGGGEWHLFNFELCSLRTCALPA